MYFFSFLSFVALKLSPKKIKLVALILGNHHQPPFFLRVASRALHYVLISTPSIICCFCCVLFLLLGEASSHLSHELKKYKFYFFGNYIYPHSKAILDIFVSDLRSGGKGESSLSDSSPSLSPPSPSLNHGYKQ